MYLFTFFPYRTNLKLYDTQWFYLKLACFWVTKVCLQLSKSLKICQNGCSTGWANFLTDWHKQLKYAIDLLLFYGEHFYGKVGKNPHSFHSKHIYIYRPHKFWSFMKFDSVYTVKVSFIFKKQLLCLYSSVYAYITP